MRRRLFNFLAVLSLLLLVATAALWVRSYFAGDKFAVSTHRIAGRELWVHSIELVSNIGNVGVVVEDVHVDYADSLVGQSLIRPRYGYVATPPLPGGGLWDHSYFVSSHSSRTGGLTRTNLGIPAWLLVLIFAIAPIAWWMKTNLLRNRRHRRPRAGLCLTCGYDNRASQERCSECGTPIPATTGATK